VATRAKTTALTRKHDFVIALGELRDDDTVGRVIYTIALEDTFQEAQYREQGVANAFRNFLYATGMKSPLKLSGVYLCHVEPNALRVVREREDLNSGTCWLCATDKS
jgi:hypothetical protein